MKKGDILTVVDAREDEGGTIVQTDHGHLLGIMKAKGVAEGTKMQVGPVCGEWCRVFLRGEAFQAQILSKQEAHSS